MEEGYEQVVVEEEVLLWIRELLRQVNVSFRLHFLLLSHSCQQTWRHFLPLSVNFVFSSIISTHCPTKVRLVWRVFFLKYFDIITFFPFFSKLLLFVVPSLDISSVSSTQQSYAFAHRFYVSSHFNVIPFIIFPVVSQLPLKQYLTANLCIIILVWRSLEAAILKKF